eukprot:768182-Hanusia_phi.AAC.4
MRGKGEGRRDGREEYETAELGEEQKVNKKGRLKKGRMQGTDRISLGLMREADNERGEFWDHNSMPLSSFSWLGSSGRNAKLSHSGNSSPVSKKDPDFDEEAQKIFAALGLGKEGSSSRYNSCDPIWKHPRTGGTIYVGNVEAASNMGISDHLRMPLYHQKTCKSRMKKGE